MTITKAFSWKDDFYGWKIQESITYHTSDTYLENRSCIHLISKLPKLLSRTLFDSTYWGNWASFYSPITFDWDYFSPFCPLLFNFKYVPQTRTFLWGFSFDKSFLFFTFSSCCCCHHLQMLDFCTSLHSYSYMRKKYFAKVNPFKYLTIFALSTTVALSINTLPQCPLLSI